MSIHSFSYIDAYGKIDIGNNVSIANHTTLISSDHTWQDNDKPIKYNQVTPKKIIIEDDIWIAAGVRVLGGKKLIKQGYEVIGIDNINDYYSVELKEDRLKSIGKDHFTFYKTDLEDYEK